jgi:hypothetical protein
MTIEDLINILGSYPKPLLLFFFLLPLLTYLYGKLYQPGKGIYPPRNYIYSIFIYLTCIPGIFAAVITIYSLLFTNQNLLQVNTLVYFIPIISMILTLIAIRQNVKLDQIPGFFRLRGLMVLLTATFILALILVRMRLWLFFGGSMIAFLIMLIILFFLLRWGSKTLFRGKL